MGEPSDVVRLSYERFGGGDIDGFIDLCSEDIRMHDVPEIPDSDWYEGKDGIRRWAESVMQALENVRFDALETIEDGEYVAVVTRARGTGVDSGIGVDWTFTTVWGVRDGLIFYHHGYSVHEQALEALKELATAR